MAERVRSIDIVALEPSPEELHECSKLWMEAQKGTCLDEWSPELMALSVETRFYEFDPKEFAKAFDGDLTEPKRLAAELAPEWDWEPHMAKLCTRSPKDVWDGHGITPAVVQSISWLCYSMRILDDVAYFCHLPERLPTLAVRKPFYGMQGLGTWEFRCFVKGDDLIAVTDYDYHAPNSALSAPDMRRTIRESIDAFYRDRVRGAISIPDYVFDVAFVSPEKIVLIETNPYGLSDPCFLKTYEGVESFSGDIAFAGMTPAPAPERGVNLRTEEEQAHG